MTNNESKIRIGLVDDHKLMRHAIAEMINSFENFEVILQADNGLDLKKKLHFLNKEKIPNIIFMDIEMNVMDGYTSTKWLKGYIPDSSKELYPWKEEYKDIKVCALSMNSKEFPIIEMLKSGATGFISKDADPHELFDSLNDMSSKGYYYSQGANKIILDNLNTLKFHPNEREINLLKLVCTELTYKEIADKMNYSKRTIDGIREVLFDKLNVKNRIGLAIYAIERGIFKIRQSN